MVTWKQRAAAAEEAVLHRHLRRLWALPATRLGVVAWPATPADRSFARWHYWWQAHLLDCLVDAFGRNPSAKRRRAIARVACGIRVRNLGSWTNAYFDDMAWLGLALRRAGSVAGVRHPDAVRTLADELAAAWSDEAGGGIPWRRGDPFRNVPANGPAAILLARVGNVRWASETADWINATLIDPGSGLVWDGVRPGGVVEKATYTYCQGVVLGAETELAVRSREPVHRERVHALVEAVCGRLADGGVLVGADGGDGGLFAGILARYLALVARQLPGAEAADEQARAGARQLVLRSAESAWSHRVEVDSRPLFGADWTSAPTAAVGHGSANTVRDLSVQLSGWMLLEAAATLTCGGRPRR